MSEIRFWERHDQGLPHGLMAVCPGHSKQKVYQPCFGQWGFSCLSTIGDILVGLTMGAVAHQGVLLG